MTSGKCWAVRCWACGIKYEASPEVVETPTRGCAYCGSSSIAATFLDYPSGHFKGDKDALGRETPYRVIKEAEIGGIRRKP